MELGGKHQRILGEGSENFSLRKRAICQSHVALPQSENRWVYKAFGRFHPVIGHEDP